MAIYILFYWLIKYKNIAFSLLFNYDTYSTKIKHKYESNIMLDGLKSCKYTIQMHNFFYIINKFFVQTFLGGNGLGGTLAYF